MKSLITMSFIDKLTNHQFIKLTKQLLINLGYKHVHLVSSGDDKGINVLCLNNKGQRVGIDCFNNNHSLNFAILEMDIIGYGLDKSIVLTNSYLTSNSLKFCKKYNVQYFGRKRLSNLVKKANELKQLTNSCISLDIDNFYTVKPTLKQLQLIDFLYSLIQRGNLQHYIDNLEHDDFKNLMINLFKILSSNQSKSNFDNLHQDGSFVVHLLNTFKSANDDYQLEICFYHSNYSNFKDKLSAKDVKKVKLSMTNSIHFKGCIITNGYFAADAKNEAKKDNILLINRDKLLKLVKDIVTNYNYIFTFTKTIDLRRELRMNVSKLKKLYKEQSHSFNKYGKDLDPANLMNYFKN